ncbi:S-adenosylmethionine decarboxylase [Plebeiibacterium marinum]|uniref:S-adenosylmethionine decarboxylase n=1 Tax=Plebeiibacterium marinum TaxID=2992111 RepID=A0AAE3MCG6_9BACT|nr:S-adenosylmethionine decarboxylase [Plebeiobacterium marinum]MCW3805002.1 S-adenosylmethionine decarboxylase [Plebeiobacterium marinum]
MKDKLEYIKLEPEIVNLKGWIQLVDEGELRAVFENTLKQSGFTILDYNAHRFPVNGYTAFWLLAESHLAIHTFTESNVTYIELSSCNQSKTNIFKSLCEKMDYNLNWDDEIKVTKPRGNPEYSL